MTQATKITYKIAHKPEKGERQRMHLLTKSLLWSKGHSGQNRPKSVCVRKFISL